MDTEDQILDLLEERLEPQEYFILVDLIATLKEEVREDERAKIKKNN